MTRVPAFVERALRRISSPSAPPIRWPEITRSNTCFSILSRASLPDWAMWTLYPLLLIDWTSPSRRVLSSSATRMFFMPPAPPRGSCWKSCSIQRVNINFDDRESRKRSAFFVFGAWIACDSPYGARQGVDDRDSAGAAKEQADNPLHACENGPGGTAERADRRSRGGRRRQDRAEQAEGRVGDPVEARQEVRLDRDHALHSLPASGDLDGHDLRDHRGLRDPLPHPVVVAPEDQARPAGAGLPPDQAVDRQVALAAEHRDL